jgi:radical SAM protein
VTTGEALKTRGKPHDIDFDTTPFLVFWEVTRACTLACRHCRATAQPRRHPQELSQEEGFHLIDQVAEMGTPLLILSGGDPMMRPDLFDFIRHGSGKGLRVSLAPSATKLVTPEAMTRAREAGLARASISLDGSTPSIHDAFRRTPGSFQRTIRAIEATREATVPIQINTTVSRFNIHDLENIRGLVAKFGAVLWDLFFLVPTGRAHQEDMISPQDHEEVFHWLYDISSQVPFDIKTTAAEHYRRVALQRGQTQHHINPVSNDGISRAAKGVNDGKGCCFVSHIGEVYPSGFLPLVAGNVRERPLADIYRGSSLFRDLRNPEKLKGKCGRCPYRVLCGGSRARAYALTGDYLEAEPNCIYQPPETSER